MIEKYQYVLRSQARHQHNCSGLGLCLQASVRTVPLHLKTLRESRQKYQAPQQVRALQTNLILSLFGNQNWIALQKCYQKLMLVVRTMSLLSHILDQENSKSLQDTCFPNRTQRVTSQDEISSPLEITGCASKPALSELTSWKLNRTKFFS